MLALVYDTETTGLIATGILDLKRQPSIIEYYGAMVEFKKTGKFVVKSELEFLCKPPEPLSSRPVKGKKTISDITGITNAMLANQPTFDHFAPKVRKQIESAPMTFAHNASYDQEMIEIEFRRLQQKIKYQRSVCTVEQTMHLLGKRMTLTGLHMHLFNEKFEAHRAKPDVLALCRCIGELHRQGII